jgi:hypothetical protein
MVGIDVYNFDHPPMLMTVFIFVTAYTVAKLLMVL